MSFVIKSMIFVALLSPDSLSDLATVNTLVVSARMSGTLDEKLTPAPNSHVCLGLPMCFSNCSAISVDSDMICLFTFEVV